MKRLKTALLTAAFVVSSSSFALAHTLLCSCFDNEDGIITCEGGFSDGSGVSGSGIIVKDVSGAVIAKGEMNEESTYNFKKPEGKYTVMLDAGEGHQVIIDSADIAE